MLPWTISTHWFSWLICLLSMSPWLHDVPIWLLDIPVFAPFKVKSCVCIPMIAFFNPMFLFTCFDASNRDGGPVLICWRGCIDVACQYICLEHWSLHFFFLVHMPSVYHIMMPWPHGPIFGASMDLRLVRGVLLRWDRFTKKCLGDRNRIGLSWFQAAVWFKLFCRLW